MRTKQCYMVLVPIGQQVSDSSLGQDKLGTIRDQLQLASQAPYVAPQGDHRPRVLFTPHFLGEACMGTG